MRNFFNLKYFFCVVLIVLDLQLSMNQYDSEFVDVDNIKQDPLTDFDCISSGDSGNIFGRKLINIKQKKEEIEIMQHSIQQPKFQCELCRKVFRKKPFLKAHEKSHQNLQCPVCLKICSARFLEKHMKIHEGERERKFQCNLCKQKFLTKNILNQHRKIHEKSFKCDFCGYVSGRKHILKQHLNNHKAGGKFKCLSCKKLFDSKSQLTNHSLKLIKNPEICMRVTKKFICKTCEKHFQNFCDLKRHEKIHNEKLSVQFVTYDALNNH